MGADECDSRVRLQTRGGNLIQIRRGGVSMKE